EEGNVAMEKLVENLIMLRIKMSVRNYRRNLNKQETSQRGFVFEERPNEVIDVSIEDEKSPSSEPRGSPHDA
nr:hypothetical protein [Tanacetum cinerariifolium]